MTRLSFQAVLKVIQQTKNADKIILGKAIYDLMESCEGFDRDISYSPQLGDMEVIATYKENDSTRRVAAVAIDPTSFRAQYFYTAQNGKILLDFDDYIFYSVFDVS